jgi:hypothetical protein
MLLAVMTKAPLLLNSRVGLLINAHALPSGKTIADIVPALPEVPLQIPWASAIVGVTAGGVAPPPPPPQAVKAATKTAKPSNRHVFIRNFP